MNKVHFISIDFSIVRTYSLFIIKVSWIIWLLFILILSIYEKIMISIHLVIQIIWSSWSYHSRIVVLMPIYRILRVEWCVLYEHLPCTWNISMNFHYIFSLSIQSSIFRLDEIYHENILCSGCGTWAWFWFKSSPIYF